MELIEQVQLILIDLHNSVQVPELTRGEALRDQIITIAQDSVSQSARSAV
jgi:hypothetical protein